MPVCQKIEEIVAYVVSLTNQRFEKEKITYEHKLKDEFSYRHKTIFICYIPNIAILSIDLILYL
jgi:hypothetical protein